MKPLVFHPEANSELLTSAQYYEGQQTAVMHLHRQPGYWRQRLD